MPYIKIQDLPASIQDHLPLHAQAIYMACFNLAWNEYKYLNKGNTDESRETLSHKVAWSAVKTKYYKVGETWQEK